MAYDDQSGDGSAVGGHDDSKNYVDTRQTDYEVAPVDEAMQKEADAEEFVA